MGLNSWGCEDLAIYSSFLSFSFNLFYYHFFHGNHTYIMASDCSPERWYEGILWHGLIIAIRKLILALKPWKSCFFQLFALAHEDILILPVWSREWLDSEIRSYSTLVVGTKMSWVMFPVHLLTFGYTYVFSQWV